MSTSLSFSVGVDAAARSKGVSYDPAAVALFDRFTTPPTNARKTLINDLIVSLKGAGVWPKLDALYLTAAADSQAARQNWIADIYNLTPSASPTFAADRGYQGDAVGASLLTAFNPALAVSPKFALNSAHIAVWSRSDVTNAAYFDIGAFGGSGLNCRSATANAMRGRINDLSHGNFNAGPSSIGHFCITRTGASVRSAYHNGALVSSGSQASTGVVDAEMTLLSQGSSVYSNRQIAAAHIGEGLTSQNMSDLYAALNTYMTVIGAA